jgi:hypothetical protein
MPSEGYKQTPAGKKKMCNPNYYTGPKGQRTMKSRDLTIISDLKISPAEYKGNVVLRANRG